MSTRTIASIIACKLQAIENCRQSGNQEWLDRHEAAVELLVKELPSGSGFDCGTKLDESSTPERLVFTTSFHHMNDDGYYDGWTDHSVIVTPSLTSNFNIRVTGRDKREIKDYIAECFEEALSAVRDEYATKAA